MFKKLSIMACSLLVACQPIESKPEQNKLALEYVCLKSQSQCEFKTEMGHFAITFAQALPASLQGNAKQGIYGELPFSVQLNVKQVDELIQVEQISAYMEGVDMFMGKVPLFFSESSARQYSADGLLANCSEETMVWRLWLTLKVKKTGGADLSEQTLFVDFTGQRS